MTLPPLDLNVAGLGNRRLRRPTMGIEHSFETRLAANLKTHSSFDMQENSGGICPRCRAQNLSTVRSQVRSTHLVDDSASLDGNDGLRWRSSRPCAFIPTVF